MNMIIINVIFITLIIATIYIYIIFPGQCSLPKHGCPVEPRRCVPRHVAKVESGSDSAKSEGGGDPSEILDGSKAMEHPNHKWRSIAGKIIYKWAIYTMAMLVMTRGYL